MGGHNAEHLWWQEWGLLALEEWTWSKAFSNLAVLSRVVPAHSITSVI